LRNFGAGLSGAKAVANPNRNALRKNGPQRFRVQNLCAEVGEFRSLTVGNLWNRARIRNKTWVRGQNAFDVGPNNDFVGIQRGA